MSRYSVSVLLAVYSCISWGLIAPFTVRLIREMGPERFHPAVPLLWNAFGNALVALVVIFVTGGAPLKVWLWHWSGWGIALVWATGSAVFTLALYFASGRASVPNLIAATYPACVTTVVLWYFFGESMTVQKVVGFLVTVVGIALVVLA